MKTIFALIKKEYRLFINDKVNVSLTFIVPIFLIFIFGSIFSSNSSPSGIHLAFINNCKTPVTDKLERTLDTMKTFILVRSYTNDEGKSIQFDTNSVKDFVRKGDASAALIIPKDAYSDTSSGLKVKFYYDPKNDVEIQLIRGMLQQTIMEQFPSLINKSLRQRALNHLGKEKGNNLNNEISGILYKYFDKKGVDFFNSTLSDTSEALNNSSVSTKNFLSDILQIQQEQLVGKDIVNPWAARSIGGWAMMFLLFSVRGSAASLFDDKKSGVVLRLLTSPVSRVHILWSKFLYNISLGIVQLLVLFIAGAIMFRIDILSNLFNLLAIIVTGATVCTAFGMVLTSISRTSAQSDGWGTFFILGMSAVGGAWFPTFIMPPLVQIIGKCTFVYWIMDGFLNVLWRNCSLFDILPNIGISLGIAAILTVISIIQFKKGHVF